MSEVFLNGQFMPAQAAQISVMDRGYLFGDGVYEVIPVYAGKAFLLAGHLARLQRSLDGIDLKNPLDNVSWQTLIQDLIARNQGGDQAVYLQITRGSAPQRDHVFPPAVLPGIFMMSNPLKPIPEHWLKTGIDAITVPDIRWQRCDIKAISLLANCLMKQQAEAAGAQEALLLRAGRLTEGAASNTYVFLDNVLITADTGPEILAGITRELVLQLAEEAGLKVSLRMATEAELHRADEIWVSSSTKELIPVTKLDGKRVGSGSPGPVWQDLFQRFQNKKQEVQA
ncbi:D-alanine aminotransferase [Methylophaga frappieri]|uniref:Aminodeoxychorismate lyase n=1 Tax=Methylophaga frappieri (strain ATCC BAA-2434 / DSM 25690 / JAM7) TaxID=754477 RepID=I1YHD2_METFJ|nr:aminotransferase class IV [Methylophaga frappieri]AFJ02325.1 D-alanine aminotransferase [Methylophaga frappieri]